MKELVSKEKTLWLLHNFAEYRTWQKSLPAPERIASEKLFSEITPLKRKSYRTLDERKKIVEKLLAAAKKNPEKLAVARLVWQNLLEFRVDDLLTADVLASSGIHPWLGAMLRGRFYLAQSWKSRGGSWAKNVSQEGWSGFVKNLQSARSEFENAYKLDASSPDAAIQMIEVASLQSLDRRENRVWLKIALAAQPDNPNAIRTYSWFSRPRWGGNVFKLKSEAEEFMKYRSSDPALAFHGLSLLQAVLSEVPVIENFMYFSFPQNFAGVKETVEQSGGPQGMDSFRKYFLGTAALLAGDMVSAEQVEKSLTREDLNFRFQMRNNEMPVLYWFDFVELNYALKRTDKRKELFDALHAGDSAQSNRILETAIKTASDACAKQGLLELYSTLNARVDWMDYRHFTPMWV